MEQTIKVIRPKSKTKGLEWLLLSFAAFNGSGYGDMSTPESFVLSYITYNAWKKRQEAVELAKEHSEELYNLASHLIETSHGASVTPNEKNMRKYLEFKKTYIVPSNLFW